MIEVREALGPEEVDAAIALRTQVFVHEQGVPPELEVDEYDATALHLLAFDDENGDLVGTYRLLADGSRMKLGRLVVAKRARRRGIASLLLADAERRSRALAMRKIVLSAQTYAAGLYAAAGYVAIGEPYDEAGIEHIWMELPLV